MDELRAKGTGWDPGTVQPPDAQLARRAACGDTGALGVLLHRHRPALLAVAIGLVGRDGADDVVHDAFIAAVRHVEQLRDVSAAGAWLRAIVRTESLMRLRARREHPDPEIERLAGTAPGPTPEEQIDRLALRDWVWASLERLSEPLRVATLLRHFATHNSYEEIAAILDVPVGTVRSRLSQARVKLADALLAEATRAHPSITQQEEASARYHGQCIDALNHGDLSGLMETWAPDIAGRHDAGPPIVGRQKLAGAIADATPRSGVWVQLDRVIASRDITILEARLRNPEHSPAHCPAETTQMHFHPGGRTRSIAFAYSSRVR